MSKTTDAVLAAVQHAAKHLVPAAAGDHGALAELKRAADALTAAHFALNREGRADLEAECLKLRDRAIALEVSAAR